MNPGNPGEIPEMRCLDNVLAVPAAGPRPPTPEHPAWRREPARLAVRCVVTRSEAERGAGAPQERDAVPGGEGGAGVHLGEEAEQPGEPISAARPTSSQRQWRPLSREVAASSATRSWRGSSGSDQRTPGADRHVGVRVEARARAPTSARSPRSAHS